MTGKIRVLATRAMAPYAQRVCTELKRFSAFDDLLKDQEQGGGLRVTRFADGEMEVDIESSVRAQDVYLFAGAARNESGYSVEENKIEMYHAVDALRRAQAGKITLFEPYISAGRSDRTTRRNSVGLWTHIKTLIGLGVDHIITYTLHSDMSVSMVDPCACAVDNIPAVSLLKRYILRRFIKTEEALRDRVRSEWLFCSVDAGGENLAKRFATAFGTQILVAHKQRDYSTPNTVVSTQILSSTSVSGKEVWIVDDMVDTGGSIYTLVRELRSRGVERVNIAAVHGVFSPPAPERLTELAEEGLLHRVVTTDTLPICARDRELYPFLEVVSSAGLSAEVIHRLHNDMAMSELFDPFKPAEYFARKKEWLGVEP